MNIEEINESQWESLKSIRLESLVDSPDAFGISYEKAKGLTTEAWKLLASGKLGHKFYIAYGNGSAVGLVGVLNTKDEHELVSMWVKPAARRQGVGKKLIKVLLEQAIAEGHTSIKLKVSSKNRHAYVLYTEVGFVETKHKIELESNNDEGMIEMVWHHKMLVLS